MQEEEYILDKIGRGERVESFETIRRRKDGTLINISVTISPIRNSSGRIIGASKIARDITQQKAAQEKLRIYSEKLEQLNYYKDEFISLASHELKTPITVIRANLQLTQMALENSPDQAFVNKALLSIDKLAALVSEMLDISKIQSGKLELHMMPFPAAQLVEDCIENIGIAHTSHEIINQSDLEGVMIEGDQQRLEQVLINLMTNAIKYSPDGNRIILTAEVEGDQLHVSVKDFGIGIPADQMDKVFTRFFRVEDLKKSYAGLGIGLYISKEIVERHNGRIWAESELGKGSTFHFTVPLQQIF
jgi:signal transduction histidine kinase